MGHDLTPFKRPSTALDRRPPLAERSNLPERSSHSRRARLIALAQAIAIAAFDAGDAIVGAVERFREDSLERRSP